MRIKIEKLKEGDNTVTFDAAEVADVLKSDYEITATEYLSLNIQKSGNYLHLHGSSPVGYRTACDRCAENFKTGVIVNIDYFFHIGEIGGSNAQDVEVIFPEKDGGDIVFDNYFRESFILALPLRSICTENCKGLCGKCGANLNTNNCSCSVEDNPDPRWEPLTKLLKNNK